MIDHEKQHTYGTFRAAMNENQIGVDYVSHFYSQSTINVDRNTVRSRKKQLLYDRYGFSSIRKSYPVLERTSAILPYRIKVLGIRRDSYCRLGGDTFNSPGRFTVISEGVFSFL